MFDQHDFKGLRTPISRNNFRRLLPKIRCMKRNTEVKTKGYGRYNQFRMSAMKAIAKDCLYIQ